MQEEALMYILIRAVSYGGQLNGILVSMVQRIV